MKKKRKTEGESNGLSLLCKSGFGLFLSQLSEECLHIVCLSGILCLHRPDLHPFCVNSCWDRCRVINHHKLKQQHVEKGALRDPLALKSDACSRLHLCETNCLVESSAWNSKNGANVAFFLVKSIFSYQKWDTARGAGWGCAFEGVCFALPTLEWFWCKATPALAAARILPFLWLFKNKEMAGDAEKTLLSQLFNEI